MLRDANPGCALRAQRRNCSTAVMGVFRCGALLDRLFCPSRSVLLSEAVAARLGREAVTADDMDVLYFNAAIAIAKALAHSLRAIARSSDAVHGLPGQPARGMQQGLHCVL